MAFLAHTNHGNESTVLFEQMYREMSLLQTPLGPKYYVQMTFVLFQVSLLIIIEVSLIQGVL